MKKDNKLAMARVALINFLETESFSEKQINDILDDIESLLGDIEVENSIPEEARSKSHGYCAVCLYRATEAKVAAGRRILDIIKSHSLSIKEAMGIIGDIKINYHTK